MKSINLRLDDALSARIDEARGDVPRLKWLRNAIEDALEGHSDLTRRDPKPSQGRSSKSSRCEHGNTVFKFGRKICRDCGAYL